MRYIRLARWLLLGILIIAVAACGGSDNGDDNESDTTQNDASSQTITTSVPAAAENETGPTLPPSAPTLPSSGAEAQPTLPSQVDLVTGTTVDEDEVTASFRFVHAAQDLDRVNVVIDGQIVFRNVALFAGTLPIRRVPGEYNFEIIEPSLAQARTGDEEVYFSGRIALEANRAIIGALWGAADTTYTFGVFDEDLSLLEPGTARLQLVNLLDNDGDIRFESNDEVLDTLASGDNQEPFVLDEGSIVLDTLRGDALVVSDEIAFESGEMVTVFLVGTIENADLIAVTNTTPPLARVRFTHAAPDTPPLQMHLNGEVKLTSIAFGETTSFELLPAERYDVTLYRVFDGTSVSDDAIPAAVGQISLPDNGAAEVVFYGQDANLIVEAFALELDPVSVNSSRVSFINTAFNATSVTMRYATREQDIVTLAFGRMLTVDLDPVQSELVFGSTDNFELLEVTNTPIRFEDGVAYTYVIVGRSTENTIVNAIDFVSADTDTTLDADVSVEQPPTIQIVNLWNQIVEVRVGGARVAFGLEPGDISAPTDFEFGAGFLEILNTEGALLFERSVGFDNTISEYTVFIAPDGAGLVTLLLPETPLSVPAEFMTIRFLNLYPGFPEIAAAADENDTAIMFYPSNSETFVLESGERPIVLFDLVQREQILSQPTFFEPNVRYDVVLTEDENGDVMVNVIARE